MAIFVLEYLNEKAPLAVQRRKSFEKKYNFEPDKGSKYTGTITDPKTGTKYRVDMNPDNPQTGADILDKDNQIYLDKYFFKLKGSHKSERRDAAMEHEIAHSKLHGIDPDHEDTKIKSPKVAKQVATNLFKDSGEGDTAYNTKDERKKIYDNRANFKNYAKYIPSDKKGKEEQKEREKAYEYAKKYDAGNHARAEEFEADRYAANRTSSRAIKKGVREYYKHMLKDIDDPDLKKIMRHTAENDMAARSKALKDKNIALNKLYK